MDQAGWGAAGCVRGTVEFPSPAAECEAALMEGISLKTFWFLLHQKALPPQVQKSLDSFLLLKKRNSLVPVRFWIGDWSSVVIHVYVLVFITLLWTGALVFSWEWHTFASNDRCRLCSFGKNCFSALSFLPHLILPQKYFLFRKGTVTSFCRLCITNFAEFLPLPKPQKYQMTLSRGCVYRTTGSLWVCWQFSLVEELSLLYVRSALTVDLRTLCVIRVLHGSTWWSYGAVGLGWALRCGTQGVATQLGKGMCGSRFASQMVLILFFRCFSVWWCSVSLEHSALP